MIISLLCTPLFLLLTGAIALLPNSAFEGQAVTGLIGMFSTAFQFFPADVWILAFGSITFWVTVHILFGVIKMIAYVILEIIP